MLSALHEGGEEEGDDATHDSRDPAIQRSSVDNVVLQLKAMGINDLLNFDFMDPPAPEALVNAMERLYTLDCLDDDGLLTPVGRKMGEFPMNPQLPKALLKSVELGCSSEVVTVVLVLSAENIYLRPKDKQVQSDQKHAMMFAPEGEHITLLTIYNQWQKNECSKRWDEGLHVAIDPKWLLELAPKLYKRVDGKKLTKAKSDQKIQPVFNYRTPDESWRMSKRKG